jgi:DNA-binding response OmpR family regulator
VLLVEDDPTILEVLASILTDEGYDARCVDTVAAALDVLRNEPVECAVLDFHLPDGTAEDVLAAAAANDASPPMVIVSASPAASPVADKFGVPLVHKPFDIEEVIESVAAAIRTGRRPLARVGKG